ncbi:hypothetical protein [Paraburkholderia aromaticivorans]|uniref:hypothetical protein n=1 Tax=Paraburkholderia aromaticivorans TaxID=2026199 RepID=UPI0014561DFA|nr:hypothetical protein [Paraburkholderia aromaticivorans]
MPETRLILSQKGGAFEVSVKRRVNFDGDTVKYLAADSLQSYVTRLYRAAGLSAVAGEPLRAALWRKVTRSTPFNHCWGTRT